jgi:hypothetical protein
VIKRLVLLLAFWSLPAASALAASFVASVNSDHVSAGKSFTLQLMLSGANATSDPDISALKQAFTIVSEAQSSKTSLINGAARSSVGWQLAMIPRREGRLVIPAVTVETSAGPLQTAPTTLDVGPGSAPASSQTGPDGSLVAVTAKASTTTPYQNQSIEFTVRCVVRGNITDVSLSAVNVANAIVQEGSKPEIHNEVANGVSVRVAEFHFIITPLQPGKTTIPPVTLRGKIEAPDTLPLNDPFGGRFSNAIRQALNYFSSFGGAPFSVSSNPALLDVKPPAAAMDPWLPLTSLKIIEDLDATRAVRIGEPLTRKLTLLADGAVGKQLPDLEARQDRANFKVYADKPTTGEDIDPNSGAILGWRKESYSLIPLQPGRLVLPAIHVSWWDIASNKIATAELPERVVDVLPGVVAQNPPVIDATGQSQGLKAKPSAPPQPPSVLAIPSDAGPAPSYGLLAILATGLLWAIFWGLKRWRKSNRAGTRTAFTAQTAARGTPAARLLSVRTLKNIRTTAELKRFLQAYAHDHWGASRNAPLESTFPAVAGSGRDDVEAVIKGIAAELYAGKPADMEDLKKRCSRILVATRKEARIRRRRLEKLGCLNPS